MSALKELFIEIESYAVMRSHATLIRKAREEMEYLNKVRIAAQEFTNARERAHDISTIVDCEEALAVALKGEK